MKKIKFKIAGFLLVLAMGGLHAEGGIWYSVENGTATITGYNENVQNLIIPEKLDGYEVRHIGNHAFYDYPSLISIEIPDSVISIGAAAFASCENLTSIKIPDSVISIEEYAFFDCDNLTSIELSENNPAYIFSDGVLCNKAKTVLYFYVASNPRTSYKIPDSVTNIRKSVFSNCKNLTTITMGNSITSIGEDAFDNFKSLTAVTIGDSVTSIEWGAFSGCKNLTTVTMNDSITNIGDFAFSDCESLTTIKIPDSVIRIGPGAFQGCSSLTSMKIPNSVTSIEGNAFRGVYFLKEVYRTTDNLRLREEEGTTSTPLFTLPTNTPVKIIARGYEATIDDIYARWVQVEVAEDTVDTQGEKIKAGTVGWCFGGYLIWEPANISYTEFEWDGI